MEYFHKRDYSNVTEDDIKSCRSGQWKPLLRQLLVCSGVWSIYFVLGLGFGAPTVFIHQTRKDANCSDVISDEMESWLGSVHGYSAVPWAIIIPIFSHFFGRKIPFLIVCLNTTVGYIVFYWSINSMQFLISEILQGMLLASNMTLLGIINTEYSSPKYRGTFMSIHEVNFYLGVWVANVTGAYSHWRHIAIIAFVLSAYTATAFMWPESPSWLAVKGRFEECAAAHRWLRGTDRESEEELKVLIETHRAYLNREEIAKESISCSVRFVRIWRIATSRSFYKPVLLGMTLLALYNFLGKVVCIMYSVQLMNEITDNESATFIGMIILEAVTIVGMQVGCVLTKTLRRRAMLIVSSFVGILFLLIISLYLYLIHLNILDENPYVSIFLLTLFSIAISFGPMILVGSIFGEISPLRYKCACVLIITLYSECLMATILKMAPYIFRLLALHGAFLFYGVSASIFTIILYKYLPETKGQTLQEIEQHFKDKIPLILSNNEQLGNLVN